MHDARLTPPSPRHPVTLCGPVQLNMALQYARLGPWRDYRYGEKVYVILSLASKSLLTWLVFGGTFQPN
jgi:hypothetical protein